MAALTRAQARAIDAAAMAELGIPGLILMENAARGIAAIVEERLGGGRGPVAVVCGPGNNGGDGFAAARHLANHGIAVRLSLAAPTIAYRAGSDAAIQHAIATAMGLAVGREPDCRGAALIVDAVLGTGLTRPVDGPLAEAIAAINAAPAPVVAVDIPSGLDADTGEVLGVAVAATVTATMVAPKVGFSRGAGPPLVGEVRTVDIGVPPALVARISGGS